MLEPPISSVADYLAHLNQVLALQAARVKGEVTGLKRSGKAVYFTIKDSGEPALLDCMIWLSLYETNGLELKEGDEVIVTGVPNIYAPFGKFSFKATTIEYAGEGALKKAYDKLKAALEAEGLLAFERKRPLPEFPRKIGVITSMSGVVIQDFTANLGQRGYQIKAIDSRVEGKDAIHELLAALRAMANQNIEVLVIMRGGGSWESLQAFNTESVVRAVAGFKVPVLTGIGHDVDQTLVELVADFGASTPTAVAKALNAPWDGLESQLRLLERRTLGGLRAWLNNAAALVNDNSNLVFRQYERHLAASRHELNRQSNLILSIFSDLARRIKAINNALLRAGGIMKANLRAKRDEITQISGRILRGQAEAFREAGRQMAAFDKAITAADPKRNMQLGYSLSFSEGKLVRRVSEVAAGQLIVTQLTDGKFTSEVKGVK
jgi:exodeoxyribonuclease VII large subunit